ncbi:MAG: chemotaxis response regulator protein-glutamate methylesterase [Nitrospirae bacterium]|nr:chemotaxis response regulator protein-glutamate methylesterase [Nitrospirota bacterium]
MLKKIRVLIVDDSAYSRQTIKGMLETDRDIEVAGVASNGVEAMAKTLKLKPDIITLDFEMPEMDGFSFLRWVMKERPTPVMMITSYSDSATVFKALELGAVDFIAKPSRRASMELNSIQDDLLVKIKGIKDLRIEKLGISRDLILKTPGETERDAPPLENTAGTQDMRVVAIGASTGGPTALQVVLTWLPPQLPAAVLISQHMPKGFTRAFSDRLAKLSRVRVREAAEGDLLECGKALVCPGGYHMTVRNKGGAPCVELKAATGRDKYVPSVDLMLSSVSECFGPAATGIILTGMGNDGKKGIVEIKGKGGYTIAEAEASAVIFGMPNEAIKTGAIDRVLPLHEIANEIIMTVTAKRDKRWKTNRA